MVLRNATNGELVASQVDRAKTFVERGLGLLPRSAVAPDEGLWIDDCSSVHTMFMRATIDLFFLDKEGTVLKIARDVPPYRPLIGCLGSKIVVELGSGERATPPVAVGDRLALE